MKRLPPARRKRNPFKQGDIGRNKSGKVFVVMVSNPGQVKRWIPWVGGKAKPQKGVRLVEFSRFEQLPPEMRSMIFAKRRQMQAQGQRGQRVRNFLSYLRQVKAAVKAFHDARLNAHVLHRAKQRSVQQIEEIERAVQKRFGISPRAVGFFKTRGSIVVGKSAVVGRTGSSEVNIVPKTNKMYEEDAEAMGMMNVRFARWIRNINEMGMEIGSMKLGGLLFDFTFGSAG